MVVIESQAQKGLNPTTAIRVFSTKFDATMLRDSSQKVLDSVRINKGFFDLSTQAAEEFAEISKDVIVRLSQTEGIYASYATADLVSALATVDHPVMQRTIAELLDMSIEKHISSTVQNQTAKSINSIVALSGSFDVPNLVANTHFGRMHSLPVKEKELKTIKPQLNVAEQTRTVLINENTHIYSETLQYLIKHGHKDVVMTILTRNSKAGYSGEGVDKNVEQFLLNVTSRTAALVTALLSERTQGAISDELKNHAVDSLTNHLKTHLEDIQDKGTLKKLLGEVIEYNRGLAESQINKIPENRKSASNTPISEEEVRQELENLLVEYPQDKFNMDLHALAQITPDYQKIETVKLYEEVQLRLLCEARDRLTKEIMSKRKKDKEKEARDAANDASHAAAKLHNASVERGAKIDAFRTLQSATVNQQKKQAGDYASLFSDIE